jgi:hypothetical protein
MDSESDLGSWDHCIDNLRSAGRAHSKQDSSEHTAEELGDYVASGPGT